MRLAVVFALSAGIAASVGGQSPVPPPDAPATVELHYSIVILHYQGRPIFTGRIVVSGGRATLSELVDPGTGPVTQALKWTATAGGRVTITGVVRGSPEAFAAEVEPHHDALAVVRHAVGAVTDRLDRAFYDRRWDWVLSVDAPTGAELVPVLAAAGDSGVSYRLTASGGEVALRFRPRFYQRHRGLTEFRPWEYRPWQRSVAGWSSWYAFFDRVTEADIHRTADVLGGVLRPFGYRYLQIDDGYEELPIGLPDHWLHPNSKFPDGLDSLERYIRSRGLEPAIWTNVSFGDSAAAATHPGWFVPGPEGRPAEGNWIGYVMDGSSAGAMDTLVTPVYTALRRMGWSYFKLDALRHLRYEGYNSHSTYFTGKGLDREQVFRGVVARVRQAIGPNAYLLACWGIRPELIGLVDGVRVGDDGFGYGSFAEYNSFNNVVWRNDPDHIELHRIDGYRAATVTTLTGSVLMLTDTPGVYRTERVEAAKRTAPVLLTHPEQLYDVDPSRSSLLAQAATQLSGSGPRPFDADQRERVSLYQLDIARPFEQWTVLARTRDDPAAIPLTELGLPPATAYLAFDFWARRFLGVVRDTLRGGPIDPRFEVQVVCLRRRLDHPQLLATGRHVTCGGPDLQDVAWKDGALSGESELVAGDPYDIYLSEPAGYRFAGVEATGARVAGTRREGGMRVVRLLSGEGGVVRWVARYGGTE